MQLLALSLLWAAALSLDTSCYDTCSTLETDEFAAAIDYECVDDALYGTLYLGDCGGTPIDSINITNFCIDCTTAFFVTLESYDNLACSGDPILVATDFLFPLDLESIGVGSNGCITNGTVSVSIGCGSTGLTAELYTTADCSGTSVREETVLELGECMDGSLVSTITCPDGVTYDAPNLVGVADFVSPIQCVNDDYCFGFDGTSFSLACDGVDWTAETFDSPDCSGTGSATLTFTSAEAGGDCPACPARYADVTFDVYLDDDCSGELFYGDAFGAILDECIEFGEGAFKLKCTDDVVTGTLYSDACQTEEETFVEQTFSCVNGTTQTVTCIGGNSSGAHALLGGMAALALVSAMVAAVY